MADCTREMEPLQQVHCLRFADFVPEIVAADTGVFEMPDEVHASAPQVLMQAQLLRPEAVNRRFSRAITGSTQIVMGVD